MGKRGSFRVRPSIHLRLATADRLRDRTCPNYIQLKRSLSLSAVARRRWIEGPLSMHQWQKVLVTTSEKLRR
jgi:hypothetical protein